MKNGLNILLVEANEESYESFSRLVEGLDGINGCISRTEDAETTIELIKAHRSWYFDICFISASIGKETSLNLVEEILDRTDCKAPLVIISGQDDLVFEASLLKRGASDVVFHDDLSVRELRRVIRYMTNQRRAQEREERLAFHDDLTSLPNRRLLQERLEQVLQHTKRHATIGALMLLDLDNFKTINDALGHSVGDQLLREVSARLQTCCRREDSVARIGGDEFAVLLPEAGADMVKALRGVSKVAGKALEALVEPVLIEQHSLHVTVSIGITMLTPESATIDAILRQADTAMYEAKSAGKDSYRFFAPEMEEMVLNQVRIENHMRMGLSNNEFYMHYQPIVHSQTFELIGAEALVRWNSPDLGQVSPAVFVPVAENSGLIWLLGEKIMEEACAFLAATPGLPQLSINISGEQIHRPNFIAFVEKVIADNALEPGRLVFELTETSLLADLKQAAEVMQRLRTIGVRFALDDFGTGYSSLSYLKRLPFDYVKIDHSFTRGVIENTDDQAIIQAILSLGEVLGFMVTAEGVETLEQLEFLQDRGCISVQGYYFSKPVSADNFRQNWIHRPANNV
ncbi:putative bifunctional diguanylate cyclase/phosphodiesterase [Kordiimonas pumila]|uniref:Bifunctional diguanylate cyclase/phosphodiesterase n=1 Tax=Kordiimonas pumila TaxID=2161677 RepID=A0ABV7D6P1_9PROT|nr:EAL domain-containing protein [Kordiimonas pumila]